jgi:hypothetical protein
MAARERELAEQRRVLADQYRLLKARPQGSAPVAAGSAPLASVAAWPPVATAAGAARRVHAPAFGAYPQKPRAGFWRRFTKTLLGTPEPVLEDSL